jgi:biotin carboxyl carrier protein
MPGTILDVLVKSGQRVRQGQTLLVMEAMKMEHRIQAPKAGEVIAVHFETGDRVDMGANLVEIGE